MRLAVSRLPRLGVLALVVMGSACSGESSHAAKPETAAKSHPAVQIVLADVADLRGTVVTLGAHPTVRSVALPGRSGGDPPVNLARVGGDIVYYGGDGAYALAGTLAGPSRRVHRGLYFVPSATPGHVWVAIQDSRHLQQRLVSRVVEVTTAGRPVLASSHRPPSRNIVGAVLAGLVVQTRAGMAIWDPQTGRIRRTLAGPFAAAIHGNVIAWCALGCPTMHVTDVAGGRDRVIPHVDRRPWEETYSGAISADGRYLALPIRVGQAQRVALVDLRSNTSRLIRGPHLSAPYVALAWNPDGDTLYYVAAGHVLAGYRVGTRRAAALPGRLHGEFTNIAILG